MKGECKHTFVSLITILCRKYCSLYKTLKRKYAYMNLQIQWFDYLRSLAVCVEEQLDEDAQIIDTVDVGGSELWERLRLRRRVEIDYVKLKR